jgi:hypothetical protein
MVTGGLVGEGEINEGFAQHRRPVQQSERSDTKGRECIGGTVGPIGLLALSELPFGRARSLRQPAGSNERAKDPA